MRFEENGKFKKGPDESVGKNKCKYTPLNEMYYEGS